MSGPDDRLLQRLAEVLGAPAEAPLEADLSRLRSVITRWRKNGSSTGGAGAEPLPGGALAPVIFHPPRPSG